MIDRRRFVGLGLWALAGCAGGRPRARARCAEPTPEDLAGPFLPRRYRGDADLTRVPGRRERARGEPIRVRGRITDQACRALPGARIEVWQANAAGRYDDERDRSGRPLDPGFQGSALLVAGAGGRYAITTVKPGAYEAPGGTTLRAPHIHFRIGAPGCHDDVVQMYFAGERLNAGDENLALLTASERRRVIIAAAGREEGAALHVFDVVLRLIDPAIDLERFSGRYLIDAPGGEPIPVTLLVVDGKLYADSPPLPRLELRPLSATRFRLKAIGVELEMDRDGFTVLDGTARMRARRR